MPIELVAIDLDDTLLHSDLSISTANVEALRRAHLSGARIVLASGRNIFSMEKYARQLGLAGEGDFIIATNGAEIVETRSARVLAETRLDPALCAEIIGELAARSFPWQVYENGLIRFQGSNPWTDLDSRLTGMPNEAVADPAQVAATGQLKFVVPGDPELLPSLRRDLLHRFAGRVEIIISKPFFLEILAAGVDKGRALTRLAALLGIALDRTLAMGDAMNDLGMLRVAGHSCAPANAIADVRAIVDWVSPLSNDEDFVADAIGRFIPGLALTEVGGIAG